MLTIALLYMPHELLVSYIAWLSNDKTVANSLVMVVQYISAKEKLPRAGIVGSRLLYMYCFTFLYCCRSCFYSDLCCCWSPIGSTGRHSLTVTSPHNWSGVLVSDGPSHWFCYGLLATYTAQSHARNWRGM